jgi:hypothetical protein
MATTRCDTLTSSLVTTGSLRALLGTTLGGISIAISSFAAPAASRARKKHKASHRDGSMYPP